MSDTPKPAYVATHQDLMATLRAVIPGCAFIVMWQRPDGTLAVDTNLSETADVRALLAEATEAVRDDEPEELQPASVNGTAT